MRFEDLKHVWREEGTGEYKRVRIEDLSTAQDQASNHLNRMVRHGLIGLGVMLLVTIPLFGWAAINAPRPPLAWPGAILLWGWLGYLFVSWWKLGAAKPDPGLPVLAAVQAELERLRMLERFRESLPWSLPAFVTGEILVFLGLSPNPSESVVTILVFSVVVLVLAVLGFRGNRGRLERTVRPLRESLEGWASDLAAFEAEEGAEEWDEPQN